MVVKIIQIVGLAIVVVAGLGCPLGPTAGVGQQAGEDRPVIGLPVDVPVMGGLDADAVSPHRGDAREPAQLSLDQVVAALPWPAYLPARGQQRVVDAGATEPVTEKPDPPVAAQRAYWAGRQAWRTGQNFEAIQYLQAAAQLSPRSAAILRLLGKIYMRSGNRIRGKVYLEKAVLLAPDHVESLFLLGRLLGEQGQWPGAIATYAFASGLAGQETDPGLSALIQYHLGHALAHQGYDAAAVTQLIAYLQQHLDLDRTTGMARQLLVLGRQRAATWQEIGDAYHRLDRPADALRAYQQAIGLDPENLSEGVVRRLVWSHLRLGQQDQALTAVQRYMQRAGADAVSLGLVRYLNEQHMDRRGLISMLRQIYDGGHHRPSLAVTIAELLDLDSAHAFLGAHMQSNPGDRSVYQYMVKRQLSDHTTTEDRIGDMLQTTVVLLTLLPSAADEYTDIFIRATGGGAALVDVIQAMPPSQRRQPIVHFVLGKALASAGRIDVAIKSLEQSIVADPHLAAPRIELATLLIDRGEFDQAGPLLDALGDRTDLRVVKLRLQVLLHQGQTNDAVTLLDGLLAQHPANSLDLVIEKANLQLATGDASQAHATLQEALETYPRAPQLYDRLIRIYRSNQVTDAEKRYQTLVRQMFNTIPHERVARIERAKLWVAGGEYDQAEPLLRTLLDEDPEDIRPLDPLLTLLVRTDRLAEAEALLDMRLPGEQTDRHLLTVALQHYRRIADRPKIVEMARRLLEAMFKDKPRDYSSLDVLMEILFQNDQEEIAQTMLDHVFTIEPADRGLLMLARRHYQRTDHKQRLFEVTEQLLLMDEPGPNRSRSLATVYLHFDRPEKAVGVLTDALTQPGGDHRVLMSLLVRALTALGQADQIDQQFDQVIARFPEQAADLTFDWAMHCERQGQWRRAQELLVNLLQTRPDHALANNALGYAWADRGEKLAQAQAMIRTALDADPNNAAYLDSMGWVLYKQGQFQEAVTWLQRASTAPGGDYPVILDHLGDALYRVGQHEAAVAMWKRVQVGLSKHDAAEDRELQGMGDRLHGKLEAVRAEGQPSLPEAPGARPSQPDDPIDSAEPADPDAAIPAPDAAVVPNAGVGESP